MSSPSGSSDLLGRFAVSPARRRKDSLARGSILAATLIALVPLVLILYYLPLKGLGSWSSSFFTTAPTGNTFFKSSSIGGIKSAILGTVEIVALASVIAVPIGIGVAVWLVEYGRGRWVAPPPRLFLAVVTGVLLAIARAAGETAPLLFTAGATLKTSFGLGSFMNSLPVQIYSDVTSPTASVEHRAWGAALTLVVMILILNLIARVVARRSRLA